MQEATTNQEVTTNADWWASRWAWFQGKVKSVVHSLVTWEWTKRLLHWLIISAGTMSECAFLIASLWMSLNSSVHPFVLLFLSEQQTVNISDLSTAAYVGLPECILGLAFVTTISHFRTWRHTKDKAAAAWFGLYVLPTAVFLVLSLVTLGCSVANQHFIMPVYGIVARAIAGYMFAFVSLLYTQLGAPQEADRLKEKDDLITQIHVAHAKFVAQIRHEKDAIITKLQAETDGIIATLKKEKDDITRHFQMENTSNLATLGSDKDRAISQVRLENQTLLAQLDLQKREMGQLKELFETVKTEKQQLFDALNQSNEDALQAYSAECFEWLNSGVRSATVDEIVRYTGHQKRKIEGAITRGSLKTATHSKETKVLISTLIPWLKQNLPSDKEPALRIVNQ